MDGANGPRGLAADLRPAATPTPKGCKELWIQVALLGLESHSLLWAQCHHPQYKGARPDDL